MCRNWRAHSISFFGTNTVLSRTPAACRGVLHLIAFSKITHTTMFNEYYPHNTGCFLTSCIIPSGPFQNSCPQLLFQHLSSSFQLFRVQGAKIPPRRSDASESDSGAAQLGERQQQAAGQGGCGKGDGEVCSAVGPFDVQVQGGELGSAMSVYETGEEASVGGGRVEGVRPGGEQGGHRDVQPVHVVQRHRGRRSCKEGTPAAQSHACAGYVHMEGYPTVQHG